MAYYGSEGGYAEIGGFTLHGPEAEGKESVTEGNNYVGTMDIRHNLEAGGSEGGTGKKVNS